MTEESTIEEVLIPEVLPEISDIGLGPWSVSKIKCLEKCPLQFYLRYIVKLKVPEPELNEDRVRTHLGSAAHSILEFIAKGHSVEDAYEIVKEKSAAYLPEEYWSEIEDNRYSIERFWQRINEFKAANPLKRILPEKKAGVTRTGDKAGFFDDDVYFRGVLDISLLLENGDAIIIDHKRGPDPKWGTKHYDFQLDCYHPLFHYGITPIEGAKTGIHFINHGEIVLRDYQRTEDAAEKTFKEIIFITEGLCEQILEAGGFFHNRGPTHCKYCDYKELCNAGKRGTCGGLEKYASASKQLINITEV